MSKRGKSDTWMPIYIGDYLADTMRLTTLQHGAYFLLMLEYWRQGPLPDDMDELCAVARADRKTWDKAIWPTLSRYFQKHDDGLLHQKRADIERANASDKKAKRADAANARWRNDPSKNDANAYANASGLDEQSICKSDDTREPPLPLPLTPYSPPAGDGDDDADQPAPETEPDEPDRGPDPIEAEFAEFWAAYPRKEAKGVAVRAFAKARKKASHDALMAAIRAWPFDEKLRNGQDFRPLPASWLNGERWLDAGISEACAHAASGPGRFDESAFVEARAKWAAAGHVGAAPRRDQFARADA